MQRRILVAVHMRAIQVIGGLHFVGQHNGAQAQARIGNVRHHQRRLKGSDFAAFVLAHHRLQIIFSRGQSDFALVKQVAADDFLIGIVGHLHGQRIAQSSRGMVLGVGDLPGKIKFGFMLPGFLQESNLRAGNLGGQNDGEFLVGAAEVRRLHHKGQVHKGHIQIHHLLELDFLFLRA